MVQQPALEVVVKLLADELPQAAAEPFNLLNEAGVMLGDNGMKYSLFQAVAKIAGSCG